MRRLLVTGAQGFVGRYLSAAALERGYAVTGLGRSPRNDTFFTHTISVGEGRAAAPLPSAVRAAFATSHYRYVAADVNDPHSVARVLRDAQPQVIIHLATALRDDDPRMLLRTNAEGAIALFDAIAIAETSPERIVFGSSAAVYAPTADLPVDETARCEPVDPYGVSKLAAELLASIRARTLSLEICFARMFNLTGAGQDERHVCGRFAAQCAALIGRENPLLVHGDLRPTRDFIDVRDVASALMDLAERGAADRAYNVCSAQETTIASILSMTLARTGLNGRVRLQPGYWRDADRARQVGNNARLRALGWLPHFTVGESVAAVVDYYLAHQPVDMLSVDPRVGA